MADLNLTVGFIAIARPTFDIPLAAEVNAQARAQLAEAGFTLVGPLPLITSLEQVEQAVSTLVHEPLDLLVALQATFADSTMVMKLAETVDTPLVLWAAPEERTGGRLRLNSLCGINLAGHALTRAHRRYDYLYAPSQDAAALERLRTLAKAGRALRLLKGARLGRIGEHPAGFDTCRVDREALRQTFGVEVVQVELNQVFEETRQTEAEAVNAVAGELQGKVGGLDQVDQTALRRSLGAYVALRRLADHEKLNGFAVRCWPEFFTELGCAACGAMSMLSDEFTPCSCEADVNGTLTQMLLQWISGEPAFGTDLVEFNPQENSAVLWHCGLAPLAMADPTVAPHAAIHSNRRLPLLMEFPLKPGRVTLARLSEATGSYRLVAGGGEMLQAPISFSGTSGVIRFDRPAAEVLDTILGEGLEHHLSLTYGDHVPVLLALAKFLDMPVLRLA